MRIVDSQEHQNPILGSFTHARNPVIPFSKDFK
jgi:hypothetical protein